MSARDEFMSAVNVAAVAAVTAVLTIGRRLADGAAEVEDPQRRRVYCRPGAARQVGLRRRLRAVSRRAPHGQSGNGPTLQGARVFSRTGQGHPREPLPKIRDTMPQGSPGTLTDDVKLQILAYVLQQNGFPAGKSDLPRRRRGPGRGRHSAARRLGRDLHHRAGRCRQTVGGAVPGLSTVPN